MRSFTRIVSNGTLFSVAHFRKHSRILSEDLEIVSVKTPTHVLQDDLGNSYSLLPTTPDEGKGTLTP